MALIRYAEGQQRSGSIGASTYSHNRYGQYIRARSIPVNPNTTRQVDVRNTMRALTIGWSTILTQDQRDAWTVYAHNITWLNALSDSVFLTGLNHYVRSNVPRILCGIDRQDDAPCILTLAIPEQQLGFTASEATQILSVTFDATADWALEDDGFQIVYMGIPKPGSTEFFNGPWRRICCILGEPPVAAKAPDGNGGNGKGNANAKTKSAKAKALVKPPHLAPPSSPTECPAAWPFCEDQRIWLRTRIGRADGRLSDFATVNFLGGA